MTTSIDRIETDVSVEPEADAGLVAGEGAGDPRWPERERFIKHAERERMMAQRIEAEGFDDRALLRPLDAGLHRRRHP